MYFVEQKYYTDGMVSVSILAEKQALQNMLGQTKNYYLCENAVPHLKAAQAPIKEIKCG